MDRSPLKAEVPTAEYKLFVRKGVPRFYLRNTNDGVYLSQKGIGWFIDGTSHAYDWKEIAGVNLVIAHVPKQGPIGTCKITFRNSSVLTILSAGKWGGSDEERNVEYGRFLTDFHRVIPQAARPTIKFETGFGKAQHIGMTVAFVIAFLFFVVMPLGLTVYFRDWQALFITLTGAAFVYPLYRMTEAAAPAEYNPDQVPPEFYP